MTDVAGEVVETGAGVKNFKAGDKVVAMLSIFVSVMSLVFKLNTVKCTTI